MLGKCVRCVGISTLFTDVQSLLLVRYAKSSIKRTCSFEGGERVDVLRAKRVQQHCDTLLEHRIGQCAPHHDHQQQPPQAYRKRRPCRHTQRSLPYLHPPRNAQVELEHVGSSRLP